MPSTATITSFYSFTALTRIRSSEANTNFSTFRGHLLPVDPNTSTAATSNTYDLGASDHYWKDVHAQGMVLYELSTGAHAVTVRSPASLTASYTFTLPVDIGTNGQFLKSTGSTTAWGSGAATAPTVQKFLSGTGTYTTPANVLYLRVTVMGGGGGGGGSSTAPGNGGAGGNSTFGSSLITCNGGAGGLFGGGSVGGAGGTASLGSALGIAVSGGSGGGSAGTLSGPGGHGGSSALGGAGGAGDAAGPGLAGATNTGGGGGGAGGLAATYDPASGGGAGGYVRAIITSPSATYAYGVGAAGAAGAGANAGGAGGSGVIVVEEYY